MHLATAVQDLPMADFKKSLIVAQFELRDSLRSKRVVLICLCFLGLSAIGSHFFIQFIRSAEQAAAEQLALSTGMPPGSIDTALIREQAMQLIVQAFPNQDLQAQLLEMQPLSIFFSMLSIWLISLLTLLLCAGGHTAEIQSGTLRFSLPRISRSSWAWGKVFGQALLLGLGLLMSAIGCVIIGALELPNFSLKDVTDLMSGAARSWYYGLTFLSAFSGISLIVRTPTAARVSSLIFGAFLAVAHFSLTTFEGLKTGPLGFLRYALPSEYQEGLWLFPQGAFFVSLFALALISIVLFTFSLLIFSRRDA